MRFVVVCPYCSRRLKAETRVVLGIVTKEHLPKCFAKARERTSKQLAERQQLALFGGDS